MQNTTGITVSFACHNSAMAAKMIEYFDKLSAESMQQFSDSLRDHPEQWTEFSPDGTVKDVTKPLNTVPPHIAYPDRSSVPPNATGSAPAPYQQQYTPPAQSTLPAPPAPPPQSAPMPQQPNPLPQSVSHSAPQPNYQQTTMPYIPTPPTLPPASAPVIQRDKLMNALQLFASSSQAHAIQVRELLARFGVDAVTALPDASLPEFTNHLRELGCCV